MVRAMSRYLLLHRAEAVTVDRLQRDVAPVAAILGLDAYVTRLRLLGTGVQPLLTDADRATLEERAAQLHAHDLRAVVYDTATERGRRPVRVRGVERAGDGLRFTGLEGAAAARIGPDDVLLIVPVALRQPDDFLRGHPHPDALGTQTRLDVLNERGDWFSIRPQGFNYTSLGPGRSPSSAANLKRLVDLLVEVAGRVEFHLGCPANFGRPMDEEARETYALRAYAAWRAGCFEGGEAAGDPSALAAVLAEAGPSDTRVLTAFPLRRRALGWRGRLPAGLTAQRLWFATWLVLAVLSVVGKNAGRHAMDHALLARLLGGVLVAGAAASVAYGLRQLRAAQRVADLPGSRVRSVAMGPAWIAGAVDIESPLSAPYSRTLCAWYQFRLERWTPRPTSYRHRSGNLWSTMLRWSAEAKGLSYDEGGWEIVNEGDSADLSFWVKDETGRIRVEPEGATLHIRGEQTFEVLSQGARYRVTERVLPLGAYVFALGTVQREEGIADGDRLVVETLRRLKSDPQALARYDVDGNGRIDEEEWELARRAVRAQVEARLAARTREDTVFIGQGEADDVFLLSDRDEVDLARRLRWFARIGLGLGLVAAIYGLRQLLGV
jgi:hypothetical protein